MKRLMVMAIVILVLCGCSRLSIDRLYDADGILREKIKSEGLFVNRANQLRLDKSSDPVMGEKDLLESAIDEDASPGNEAMRNLLEMYKLGAAGAK